MSPHRLHRIVAVLAGAAVVFGLEQGLGAKLYIAIGAGILTYVAVLVGLTLMLGSDRAAK